MEYNAIIKKSFWFIPIEFEGISVSTVVWERTNAVRYVNNHLSVVKQVIEGWNLSYIYVYCLHKAVNTGYLGCGGYWKGGKSYSEVRIKKIKKCPCFPSFKIIFHSQENLGNARLH